MKQLSSNDGANQPQGDVVQWTGLCRCLACSGCRQSRHPVFDGVVFESLKPNTKERLVHMDWYQQAGENFMNHVYHVANSLKYS